MSMIPIIVFDFCETVLITALLAISIPIACFTYWKLLVVSPFAENFTFKLIVLNGATSLLYGVAYLIFFQLCSYSFMFDFYDFIQNNNLTNAVAIINAFFKKMSLHSALFVALNRLKTVLSLRPKGNDFLFFIISMICSLILTLPAIIDLCVFSTSKYQKLEWMEKKIFYPSSETVDEKLRTISSVLSIVVSLATFVINIILVVCIVKERQRFERSENRKFDVEIGLMVTSVVSYIFYMLFFINGMLAQHLKIFFSAAAQFLFLGLSALTPFWCLIVFTPSIRRLVINKNCEISAVSITSGSKSGI